MKFNIPAATITGGVGFAIALGACGLLNIAFDGYAQPLLELMASVYPGYDASGTIGDLIIGCLYAVVDGCIAGCGLALLYNLAASWLKKG
jgi:hypothetical protein